MNKFSLLIVVLFFSWGLMAQEGDVARSVGIEEVAVTARRSVKDVGVQKTVLDSMVMRENVTNSLADVLSYSTPIFIKSYGRATLSTASFRGTAPSHTQVTWNGMKINSPMLGMTDFSLIPSFFIDDAALYHGASSVSTTGGGLGGAVSLSTGVPKEKGAALRYVQGVGSYHTFDEFLQFSYGGEKWSSSTRVSCATSKNDFPYTNIYKKDFIYDADGTIVGYTRPRERNQSGYYRDIHLLQEAYYTNKRWRASVTVWYMNSSRGVPLLNVDLSGDDSSKRRQDERTLRAVMGASYRGRVSRYEVQAGYSYTDLGYSYKNNDNDGNFVELINSRSFVNTIFGRVGGEWYIGERLVVTADATLNQHFVNSSDRAVLTVGSDKNVILGYNKARPEFSAMASLRWKPTDRLGVGLTLREEVFGGKASPIIPAAFTEYMISRKGNVVVKASAARNFRFPTLNDLYFMPGGNPDLKEERGFTYDAGVEFSVNRGRVEFGGEAAFYDSHISDWILWMATGRGVWTPVNVAKVRSYGTEVRGHVVADLGRQWHLSLHGNFALTNSINKGKPVSPADMSVGRQLPYIPKYSAAVTGSLRWRDWEFLYKWNYYSERFTTTDNDVTSRTSRVAPYYMSDISLTRTIDTRPLRLSVKAAVNNLFNEEYESVLSRPMPRRNYGIYIEITPKFKKR